MRQLQVRRNPPFALHKQPLARVVRWLILHRMKFLARRALKDRQEELVDLRVIARPGGHELIDHAARTTAAQLSRDRGGRARSVARMRSVSRVIMRRQDSLRAAESVVNAAGVFSRRRTAVNRTAVNR
jgi:hypothetical protein